MPLDRRVYALTYDELGAAQAAGGIACAGQRRSRLGLPAGARAGVDWRSAAAVVDPSHERGTRLRDGLAARISSAWPPQNAGTNWSTLPRRRDRVSLAEHSVDSGAELVDQIGICRVCERRVTRHQFSGQWSSWEIDR